MTVRQGCALSFSPSSVNNMVRGADPTGALLFGGGGAGDAAGAEGVPEVVDQGGDVGVVNRGALVPLEAHLVLVGVLDDAGVGLVAGVVVGGLKLGQRAGHGVD